MAVNRVWLVTAALVVVVFVGLAVADDHEDPAADVGGEPQEGSDTPQLDSEELEYHKGSLCGYCTYCKFCKLCDKDCPCERGPTKPNCHMCKYCKYCYLCKMCDTVCQPGGFIDRVTSKLFNALPRYNKDDIDKDIEAVKGWIEKSKDEL